MEALRPLSPAGVDLDDPALHINRELSWLAFNSRVLDLALDQGLPLLERVKFLSIFANNLDEFFMIRVSGLRRQVAGGIIELAPDALPPTQLLATIRESLEQQLARQASCWSDDLLPGLADAAVRVLRFAEVPPRQQEWLRRLFAEAIFPVLTPLAFDPAHPFPHISNLSLNLAVVVRDPVHGENFARVKIADVFPRLLPMPSEADAVRAPPILPDETRAESFVWLEEVVAANLDLLFPGVEVISSYPFRVTRDADLEIKEDEASDLLTNIEELVELRHWGSVVRLEVDQRTPDFIREVLVRNLEINPTQVYQFAEPLGLSNLMALTRLDRPDLKVTPFFPLAPPELSRKESIFEVLRRQNLLLYHPYDSFLPVVDFIREAAADPQVLAIKQTLYRVGANSPVVDALMAARENGKQVAVLVELRARFDEENNIAWARALEDEGVHVGYGVLGLKTHAKVCLVVRQEPEGIRRYVHFGTGNYNTLTGRTYADLSYFTADEMLAADASDLFNALTGYSRKGPYRRLLVAPGHMREEIITRIEREEGRQRHHGDGYLAFKMNSLVDKQCIQALYRASQAGVRVELQVRGICCLRPGVPGVSENIRVTSIVGRFLEHARIFHFHNGGEDEVFVGSADLMPRNLDRRVELLFPVEDPMLRRIVVNDILGVHLRDTAQARVLLPNGAYQRQSIQRGEEPFDSQAWLMANWRTAGAQRPE